MAGRHVVQQIRQLRPDYPATNPELNSRGLANRDMYCYRNSVIQSLMHVPKVLYFFEKHKETHEVPEPGCLSCILRTLSNDYWGQSPNLHTDVVQFDRWFNNKFHSFNNHDQQDADDFYGVFINYLHERDYLHPLEFRALFGMQVSRQTVFKHNDCGHSPLTSLDVVNVAGISLNLLQPAEGLSFNQYLHTHFNEPIEKTCACNTNRKEDGMIVTRIDEAPEVLKINIARVGWRDVRGAWAPKQFLIRNKVDIPLYIDLSPFATHPADQQPGTFYYKLQCMVVHTGPSPNAGHYTAIVTAPTGVKHINDMEIERSRLADMVEGKVGRTSKTVFILFYQRVRE
ncbi:cysteine proteinase [Saccharata proteae CBS 121410]|uniref:Cysteine proteinase n=1 Tax=Saccharata proteae CBS 121410 TaxID=1314787 RepID=A0A9P4HUD0_9PEZI|nr:cysteine proteinase [Saccharata proteae CBS 121410]